MRSKGIDGTRPPGARDREPWQRGRAAEAFDDEIKRLMDLAAFADRRLGDGEADRVAALIARDPGAIEDVLIARGLTGAAPAVADERIVARAVALVPGEASSGALVIAFPQRHVAANPRHAGAWYAAARWSGLAAAMVLAGWLGFDLGSGLPNAPSFGRGDPASANELLDPAPPLVRDFIEGWQT
jgi:hypothetical protein